MPRYKLTIEYDGTDFVGWQRQQNHPSVQQHLEEAVSAYFNTSERMVVQCSGRTDAGVHARGQVAHVDFPSARDERSITQGLGYHLKTNAISVLRAEPVADDFHARFHAKMRYYEYIIINRRASLALDKLRAWNIGEPLEASAMHQAAQILLGEHDFSSFRDAQCQSHSPIKTIHSIEVTRQGDRIITRLAAKSFLHHQVRITMGCLRNIGNGKWTINDLQKVLDAKDRTVSGETAPACGLTFMQVDY